MSDASPLRYPQVRQQMSRTIISGREAGQAPDFEVSTPRPNASILLVDDQPARLLTYEAMLNGLGVQCVRALSGREALERLLQQEFAVLVLDVSMPEMDGFELAALIREHPRLERTPIIFVTGVNISELDRLKGYEVGAIDYIQVPVVPEILRSKVALLVELHQRRSQLQALNRALQEARTQSDAAHANELAEKDALLRAVFEHPNQTTTIMKAMRDASGTIVDWAYYDANANALRLLGRTRDTLIGQTVSRIVGERSAWTNALCTQVLESQQAVRYETRFERVDFLNTVFPAGPDTVISSGIDITEQRHLQETLKLADRRKDEFLAMLAHELRNPVAPIRNAAEVLARLVKDDQPRSLITMIQRQGAHLTRILDDLLDVARITQGRIELKREPLSLAAAIDAAIETVQPQIQAKGHQLTVSRTSLPVLVHADKVRIEQCVTNMLSNAVKYTDPGGEIWVRLYTERSDAVVEVSDNGIGMPAEFLPHVFELFAQSERSLDRSQGGLGVGLSVCKQLIEMHGGRIRCDSAGVGRGSTFTLRLPILAEREATPSKPARTQALERILIVDDNRDAADSLAMYLEIEGHETRVVYSAEEGLQAVARFQPQVVLLDIGLPRMDGYEVARRIRVMGRPVHLIALTGYGQEEDRQRTAAAGFDVHLTKPVDLALLVENITKNKLAAGD